ncbi:MAG: hypothetical protein ABJP48_13490 [Erythrobacter sp.]
MNKVIIPGIAAAIALAGIAGPGQAQDGNAQDGNAQVAAAQPLTQTAQNGSYWAADLDQSETDPRYFEMENLCITENGKRFFGVQAGTGTEGATVLSDEGNFPISISAVDASASKRHFTLSTPVFPNELLTLNFIAPGARETHNAMSATAGLSSISNDAMQVDCTDHDNLVAVVASPQGGISITLEEGELVLRSPFRSGDENLDLRGGMVSHDADGTRFLFLKEDMRVQITLDAGGAANYGSILFESPIKHRLGAPSAYFLANPETILERAPATDASTIGLIDRLAQCNHFAGEASEDAERNAQIGERWEELACDAVPAQRSALLTANDAGDPLHAYLTANDIVW